MAISVGTYTFDARTTTVRETYERVGGKETRLITLTGLLRGLADRGAIDTALDGIMAAVSTEDPVYVSIREGRRIRARRESLAREIHGHHLTGQFVVGMRAETAYEESTDPHESPWSIFSSGATLSVANSGNRETVPVVTLTALGSVIGPAVSDGTHTISYGGVLDFGAVLQFDGEGGRVWLDGADVTAYTTGAMPRLAPGETSLTYTDDASSSHLLSGTVTWRDRWW